MPGAFTSKPWVTAEGPKLRGEYHRLSVWELSQRTTRSGGLKQQKYILIELRSPEVQTWGAGRAVRGSRSLPPSKHWGVSRHTWCPLACKRLTPTSASIITWPSSHGFSHRPLIDIRLMASELSLGNSLAVQWLRLCTPDAGGPSSIRDQETRFHIQPGAVQKKKKKKRTQPTLIVVTS